MYHQAKKQEQPNKVCWLGAIGFAGTQQVVTCQSLALRKALETTTPPLPPRTQTTSVGLGTFQDSSWPHTTKAKLEG